MHGFFKRQSWFTIFLLGIFLIAALGPVYANSIDELREEQKQNQKEIEEIEGVIDELKGKEDNVLEDIKVIAGNVARLEDELRQIDVELTRLEKEIVVAEEELIEAEVKLEERSHILNSRVRTIYEKGTVGYLEVLLRAESFSDFLSRWEFLRKIAEQDSTLVKEIKAEREAIVAKKIELERKKAQVKVLKDRVEENKEELAKEKALEEEKLTLLRQDRKAAEREQTLLEEDNRKAEQLIKKYLEEEARKNNPPSEDGDSGGVYAWPTPGYKRISSPYGNRIHPIYRVPRMHTGIDIAAPRGVTVVSVESGIVIYTSGSGGYGNHIIVSHSGGKQTLYAHLDRITTSVGASVQRGQKIGEIGSTGASTGPHLHFEVRVNGSHTNPMNYLN